MSYSTELSLLMYHIRNEFYKITDTSIIDVISSLSPESIEEAFYKFEKVKLTFEDIKAKVSDIPINTAKRILRLTKNPDIRGLIEDYMLYYEFYNLNTLLRARLSGYNEKSLFLFDYSTISSREEMLSLDTVEKVKSLYYKVLSYHKIKNKKLKDALRVVSPSNVGDVMLYSSIEYYSNLMHKRVVFGNNLDRIIRIKAFYELLLTFAKMKFIGGVDVEKHIQLVSFLGDRQNMMYDIFISSKENFIKKCIDYNILPPNFLMTDLDDIDRFKNAILKNICKSIIVGNPLDPATVVAIIVLREIDMKNYFAIVGGYVSGFNIETIRQLLVL